MNPTELQDRITLLEAENTALHQSAAHAENALAQCRTRSDTLAAQLADLTGVHAQLQRASARAEAECRQLRQRVAELETQLEPLNEKLSRAEAEGRQRLSELNRLRIQNTDRAIAQTEDPDFVPSPGELTLAELNMLGYCHSKGLGGPRDPVAALRYFMRAAALNDPVAQYNVGFAFYDGRGCKPNDERAYRWFKLAAGGGSVDARYYLGECCERGRGVPVDWAEALRNYEIAAEAHDEPSMVRAAEIHYYGMAGKSNPGAALHWLRRLWAVNADSARRLAERFRKDRIKAQASSTVDMELQELLESGGLRA